MNKKDLVEKVALMTHHTKKDTGEIVDSFLAAIEETLADGDRVQLVGFGCFECRERSERMARNPHTKERIKISATTVPVFRAGKEFKAMVDKHS